MDGPQHDARNHGSHGRLHRPGDHVGRRDEFTGEPRARKPHVGHAPSSAARRHPGQNQIHLTMNRRTFLHSTAMAAAATAVAPAIAAETAPKKRAIKKAIMYATIGVKGSVMEKFAAVKEAGFEGVEAMGGMSNDEVLEAAKTHGLKIPSVCCHTHWAVPLSDPNPETRKVGL